MRSKRLSVRRPTLDRLEARCLLATAPYSPSQILAAYGLSGATYTLPSGLKVPGTGVGETIAVVVAYHDPYLASDLATFDRTYGVSGLTSTLNPSTSYATPSLTQYPLTGATDTGWAQEVTLDVEWVHALAPGANIVVVEAKSDSTNDLLSAVAFARALPSVNVVAMSWGGSEPTNEKALDVFFTTPAGHQGITFLAASGDSGAAGGAEWPASSPNVVGVGGTTLRISGAGNYGGETAWSSSQGGYSLYEAEPYYQYAKQQTGRRSSPDVAFDGDPNTGVQVYTTDPATGQGSWSVVAGTSLSTPAWAAVIAMVDEGREFNGLPSLDGATQTLPVLYNLPSTAYNSITPAVVYAGRRSVSVTTPLISTGLGSPNGYNFLSLFVSGVSTDASRAALGPATSFNSVTTTAATITATTSTTTSLIAPATATSASAAASIPIPIVGATTPVPQPLFPSSTSDLTTGSRFGEVTPPWYATWLNNFWGAYARSITGGPSTTASRGLVGLGVGTDGAITPPPVAISGLGATGSGTNATTSGPNATARTTTSATPGSVALPRTGTATPVTVHYDALGVAKPGTLPSVTTPTILQNAPAVLKLIDEALEDIGIGPFRPH